MGPSLEKTILSRNRCKCKRDFRMSSIEASGAGLVVEAPEAGLFRIAGKMLVALDVSGGPS